jgi:hypothetical protein
VPFLVFVLIALSLATAGALLGRTEAGQDFIDQLTGNDDDASQEPSAPTDEGEPIDALAIASVTSFDPQGTDGENDDLLPLAHDGDTSTAWTTEGYDARDMAGKEGAGFVVELAGTTELEQLDLTSSTQDWAVEIYVADRASGDLAGWGDPVASAEGINGSVSLDLDGAEGGAILVWITDVGSGPPQVRAEIAELVLS